MVEPVRNQKRKNTAAATRQVTVSIDHAEDQMVLETVFLQASAPVPSHPALAPVSSAEIAEHRPYALAPQEHLPVAPLSTVFVIDDDELDILMYERVFQRSAAVERAVNFSFAQSALEVLESGERPELIFLDINMPGMSGFDFLRAIEDSPTLDLEMFPTVIMSTSDLAEDREQARSFDNVIAYFTKPPCVSMIRLLACCSRASREEREALSNVLFSKRSVIDLRAVEDAIQQLLGPSTTA